VDAQPHGEGAEVKPDGTCFEGQWTRGKSQVQQMGPILQQMSSILKKSKSPMLEPKSPMLKTKSPMSEQMRPTL